MTLVVGAPGNSYEPVHQYF